MPRLKRLQRAAATPSSLILTTDNQQMNRSRSPSMNGRRKNAYGSQQNIAQKTQW
jgi:hypothetical protein